MVPSTGSIVAAGGGMFPPSEGLEAAIKEPKGLSVDRAEEVERHPRSARPWGNQQSPATAWKESPQYPNRTQEAVGKCNTARRTGQPRAP